MGRRVAKNYYHTTFNKPLFINVTNEYRMKAFKEIFDHTWLIVFNSYYIC